jgi:hypothetical protein
VAWATPAASNRVTDPRLERGEGIDVERRALHELAEAAAQDAAALRAAG